jgi:hypothetical protein
MGLLFPSGFRRRHARMGTKNAGNIKDVFASVFAKPAYSVQI